MRKVRKSIKDITNEIQYIIKNNNTGTDLNIAIKKYLDNLTGKECLVKPKIELMFCFEINKVKPELFDDDNFINNCSISKKFLFKRNLNKYSKLFSTLTYNSGFYCQSIILQIIYKNRDKIKFDELKDDIPDILKREKSLMKFYRYISENFEISKLLYETIHKIPDLTILEWIENKKIPLSTIKHLFDKYKDNKENIEYFYKALNKKFSKTQILDSITKSLNKKGKN
jgi:hypothetical protein